MKITHTTSGLPYHLKPGTQLEVERTNLFFNEFGEQTLPVELPDTDRNRQLTGYLDLIGNKKKPSARISATIQDGEYFMSCRQAILSVQRKESISTSFYINEGSFLSRISKTSLTEVFADETISGVKTVKEGIDFCKSLFANTNPQFAIFPVIVDFDNARRYINRFEYMDTSGNISSAQNAKVGLYNEYTRSEKVNDNDIYLDPGYYITPFLRADYLLRRILSHFGYTLTNNFFSTTVPFKDMVFLNNTMDSLVNGTILLSHLVPDCMCSTILNVYRKKFCCEFIPDEVRKTITIELFNDAVSVPPTCDLSDCLTSYPVIDFPEYQQLKLSSESCIEDGDQYDSVAELKSKYPEAWFDNSNSAYYHTGYSSRGVLVEKIGAATIPYYAGGNLKAKEVKCPDASFSILPSLIVRSSGGRPQPKAYSEWSPYIGEGRSLNSTLILSSTTLSEEIATSEEESTASNKEQSPMLAFLLFQKEGYCIGTNTNYRGTTRLWNYTLLYNGPDGIFERFYRKYDNMLRNSLHPIKAKLLLSGAQKMNLPAHRKVIIQGQELLINKLKYYLGGKNEPVESELMTTHLYEPVSTAIPEADRLPDNSISKWYITAEYTEISEAEYNAIPNKGSLPAIYPPPPTAEQIKNGGTYYKRAYCYKFIHRITGKPGFRKVDWALQTTPPDSSSRPK